MSGLQYTQHTRAFPTLAIYPLHSWVREELNLSWDWGEDDSGINGSVSLCWFWFGRQLSDDPWAIQWEFFSDSIELFQRDEIQKLLAWLRQCSEDEKTPNCDAVIEYLDNLGFTPSQYHTQHDTKE